MSHVILVGFMGSGKSTVGPLLAANLQRPFVDLDARIEADAARSIADLFEHEGEDGFRRRESAMLDRVLREPDAVVAVGGGAPMRDENWSRMRDGHVVVALAASSKTLAARLGDGTGRPLLQDGPTEAIERLLAVRGPRYEDADLVVSTDGPTPGAVAEQIAGAIPAGALSRIQVRVEGHAHEIVVGANLSALALPIMRRAGVEGRVVIVTDERVGALHAPSLEAAIEATGLRLACYALPAGEDAKTLTAIADLYRFLATAGVDRHGAILALGGGAVGDAAGFAAATWLRGVPVLHLPTTLLAMIDSSIGGKNGVNLEVGKNLVGTIHQPCGILVDIGYLRTLPDREYRASWAEVIKSAIIADRELFAALDNAPLALSREAGFLHRVITATCAIKARVVETDPFEHGVRAILNYGHTVGHALEAALGYGTLAHGEAVAWGMQVAADLSRRTGRCTDEVVQAQTHLLQAYGLLAEPPRVDPERLFAAMRHDKKARDGEVRWVLLQDIGKADYGCRVPASDVEASLQQVLG